MIKHYKRHVKGKYGYKVCTEVLFMKMLHRLLNNNNYSHDVRQRVDAIGQITSIKRMNTKVKSGFLNFFIQLKF